MNNKKLICGISDLTPSLSFDSTSPLIRLDSHNHMGHGFYLKSVHKLRFFINLHGFPDSFRRILKVSS